MRELRQAATRRWLVVLVWVVLLAVLAAPAWAAQEVPPTAQEGVAQVALVLTMAAGLVGSALADAIKRAPIFTTGERTLISNWVAMLVTGVLSILVGYLTTFLARYAADIDRLGLWQVVIVVGPWLVAEIRYQLVAFRKARG